MMTKIHPAAKAFPILIGSAFDELVEDIRKNGQRFPVVFDGEVLLDGRNRIRACEKLGLDYEHEQWDRRGSVIDFIVSANIHRRHLTSGQRAMVGAELLPGLRAEAKKRQRAGGGSGPSGRRRAGPGNNSGTDARDAAARAVGVSSRYVDHAERIKRQAPELAARVQSGAMNIPRALGAVGQPQPTTKERKCVNARPLIQRWEAAAAWRPGRKPALKLPRLL